MGKGLKISEGCDGKGLGLSTTNNFEGGNY